MSIKKFIILKIKVTDSSGLFKLTETDLSIKLIPFKELPLNEKTKTKNKNVMLSKLDRTVKV